MYNMMMMRAVCWMDGCTRPHSFVRSRSRTHPHLQRLLRAVEPAEEPNLPRLSSSSSSSCVACVRVYTQSTIIKRRAMIFR